MAQGIVKFFRPEKGCGAITSPELPDGRDEFAHYTAIEGEGFRMLSEGECVEFDYEQRRQDSFQYVATRVRQL
ncbi:cold-shock protein [Mycobacteroides abscessus]|uniref:cold-shock protein n=1 Tax=Mycobacteroides abscessus TaxID=36809 RepID=UPI0011C35CA9|nr:cold shock domain-containing protein [Mycobacteroides abscessus]